MNCDLAFQWNNRFVFLIVLAGLNYLRTFEQYKSDLKTENAVFSEGISYADMLHATQYVKPSGLRELQIEVPQVRSFSSL